MDYCGQNNLIIKNGYLLLLIGNSLNCLQKIKPFTKLDLIHIYYRMRIREVNKWKTIFKLRYIL